MSAGVIVRGEHCSKSCRRCPPPRASCMPQSRPRPRGSGFRAWRRTFGISCRLESAPRRLSNDVLGQPQRSGGLCKAKRVDMQNLWIQEASKSGRFITKKVGTNVNRSRLHDEAAGETEDRAGHEPDGSRVHEDSVGMH